ncbi:MAG: AI-2E family transporter, partial [Burkholderiales bacterium]
LKDWHTMLSQIHSWLPRAYVDTISEVTDKINSTLSGYLRGQVQVCLVMAAFYSVGLSLIGVEFGLAIGLVTGLFCFLPFITYFIGLVSALSISYLQFNDVWHPISVLVLYMIGLFIENYIIAPRLVGDKIGLPPVWMIFAVFVGASIAGITGVIIATPVAAILGVLMRFGLQKYLHSSFYQTSRLEYSPK